MKKISAILCRFLAASIVLLASRVGAQQVQFSQPNIGAAAPLAAPPAAAPAFQAAPLGRPPAQGASGFDAYSTHPSAAATAPTLLPPTGTLPPSVMGVPPLAPQPQGVYPAGQAPALFPNGFGGGVGAPSLKLFQNVRGQYTWLGGSGGVDSLDINDVEVATTLAFPNFIYSGRPLLVSPGFQWHLWSGPDTPPAPPAAPRPDLPGSAYSAYVDFGWFPQSRFIPQLSGEIAARVGLFTDFNAITTDSFRVRGTALAVLQLTPTLSFKGGVNYINRVDIKLLPAIGLLWTPNPHTRWDIYFPRPKFSQFLYTVGTTDVWWYVGGEYGGGSWTIERASGASDQVDINDIRVFVGFDWTQPAGLKGFLEAGYVFERQLVYRSTVDNINLEDTFMVRAGLAF